MLAFQSIIFDFDDTLIASGGIWRQAETRLFTHLGHSFAVEIACVYRGMNAMDVGRVIHEQLKPSQTTAEECGYLLREYLLEGFLAGVAPMSGADALLRALNENYELALASGSPLGAIQRVLERFHWATFFSLILSSDNMANGKPEPDIYLEVAHQLNCNPRDILVVEDSLHGVRSAKRAGMTCFVVPSCVDPAIVEEADRTFSSLDNIREYCI